MQTETLTFKTDCRIYTVVIGISQRGRTILVEAGAAVCRILNGESGERVDVYSPEIGERIALSRLENTPMTLFEITGVAMDLSFATRMILDSEDFRAAIWNIVNIRKQAYSWEPFASEIMQEILAFQEEQMRVREEEQIAWRERQEELDLLNLLSYMEDSNIFCENPF